MVSVLLAHLATSQGLASYPLTYEKTVAGAPQVYVVAGPGKQPIVVPRASQPSVVQGGRTIAYVSLPVEGHSTIVVANAKAETLFTYSVSGAEVSAPSFSANGAALAFVADTAEGRSIMSVRLAKGAAPVKLADAAPGSPDPKPVFKGDGSALVFNLGGSWVEYSLQSGAIRVIDTNRWISDLPKGLRVDALLPDYATPARTVFSVVPANGDPAGLRAVFVREGQDGGTYRLSQIGAKAGKPRWSADGRTVLFEATDDQGEALFAVRSDGKNLTRLVSIGESP